MQLPLRILSSLFFKKLVHRWGSAYFAAEAEAAEAEADE